MKMHPGLIRITAAAVMSTFVPAVTLTSVFVPAGAAVAAPKKASSASALVQVITTQTDAQGNAKQVVIAGTFTPTSFQAANGVLTVVGNVTGITGTDPTTGATTTLPDQMGVSALVTNVDPSCSILDLTLGPLNLNLLGLVVTLNQVHLTITAVPGAGNLLGNLLCAVANLLNGTGSASTIIGSLVTLLNDILAALP